MGADHLRARKQTRLVLQGLGASPGQALGPARVIASGEPRVPARGVAEHELRGEIRLFGRALRAARDEIRELREKLGHGPDDPAVQILTSHAMILQDRELTHEVVAAIRSERMNAAFVVRRVFLAKAHYLEALPSEVFSGRAADIRDVERRLLRHLLGEAPATAQITPGSVVVASELGPSETAGLTRERVAALVTRHGTLTSHVTILARSRGLPAVIGLGDALEGIPDGEVLLVDGDQGLVIIAPNQQDLEAHRRTVRRQQRIRSLLEGRERVPVETRDGRRVPVLANIDRPADAAVALDSGAEGIGLYRTEFLYMESPTFPSEEAQTAAYRQVVEAFPGRPVTIRTLDLGGDKHGTLTGVAREENPFLGLRGIRFCLEHTEVFRVQLRAILRASAASRAQILLPMIGSPAQLRATRALIEQSVAELRAEGVTLPERLPVGVMIELPAAVLMSDVLAREADYFSIGSNDLIQYCLAVDRGNGEIAQLYDPLDPAVLRAIDLTVRNAHAAGIRVGSCGEMSGELPGLLLLIGMDVDELSVAPYAVPRTRALLGQLRAADLQKLARRCLGGSAVQEVRQIIREELAPLAQFRVTEHDGQFLCHWDPEVA